VAALTAGDAALAAATFAVAAAATRAVLGVLRRKAILDVPNERSSHTVPTPRGGGWGLLAGLLPALAAIWAADGGPPPAAAAALAGAALLAAVSWLDDRRSLGPLVRLAAQGAAAALLLWALPTDALVLQGAAPAWLDRLGTWLALVWFVNLFNFMDGIDGIAGAEAAAVGIGVALVALVAGIGGPLGGSGVALAAAALGFLVWNWHPARVFMGDVGSVPVGFLAGWLLIELAAAGALAAAALLPLYFVADATYTLLRRALRGERVWQAHREHAYQAAVRRGLRHDAVVLRVAALNAALLALAVLSVGGPAQGAAAVAAGLALTGWTMRTLVGNGRTAPASGEGSSA
jgi:UDP-N-acetylmuramyl pentapeptide phosphotransferase/UDP-N-acetylglucosamine-1-phosphate transferase